MVNTGADSMKTLVHSFTTALLADIYIQLLRWVCEFLNRYRAGCDVKEERLACG